MNFFAWHYSAGLKLYLSRWRGAVNWVIHYFSLPRLILSLFSPYRRLVMTERIVGFNLQKWFEQFSYNIISRFIGAGVRLTLFFVGLFLLIPISLFGVIGLVFWLLVPPIGLIYYVFHDPQDQRHLKKLVDQLNKHPKQAVQLLLNSEPGKFLTSHLGVDQSALTPPIYIDVILPQMTVITMTQIAHSYIEAGYWDRKYLNPANLEPADILLAAHWWDRQHDLVLNNEESPGFGQPGIGLELLFGYTPTLDKYGTDLTVIPKFANHLIARSELVSRIERSLTTGRSVVLAGLPGVGKKTIVLEFAYKCRTGQLGNELSYKRVIEFDYNILLSQSIDINQKKFLLSNILEEATRAGNVILVIKDLYRLISSDVEGVDFTDIFDKYFETGKLLLIAISSSNEYERYIAPNNRIRKHMDIIEANPPTSDEATEILLEFATSIEYRDKVLITVPAIRAAVSGSDKYVTDTPFPEKALELIDHAIAYARKQNRLQVIKDDVNQVLSERTGVSLARLTESEKNKLANIEELLHKRVVGQNQAVELVAKTLRARAAGTKSENRPLGSFLFLGPTGVGKTETAKALAEVYYGSENSILRFDMAEYAGPEGLIRLMGSVSRNQPGLLTTSIKNHPASLLLLDEIEKAPPEVFNLFLSLLDEGIITDSFGQKIICRNLFVIATSNAGASHIRDLVTDNQSGNLSRNVIDFIQKQGLFSPEFLNRFDGVVVFEPLREEQLKSIAQNLVNQTISNLSKQSISLTVSKEAIEKLAKIGFEPEYGARPMRRIVEIEIGDLLGKGILSGAIQPGERIEIIPAEPGPFAYRKPQYQTAV